MGLGHAENTFISWSLFNCLPGGRGGRGGGGSVLQSLWSMRERESRHDHKNNIRRFCSGRGDVRAISRDSFINISYRKFSASFQKNIRNSLGGNKGSRGCQGHGGYPIRVTVGYHGLPGGTGENQGDQGYQGLTLQRTNTENLKQIFPETELRGPSPKFHNSHNQSAYSATGNMWTRPGNIQIAHRCTWMWKLELGPRNSQKRTS